MKLGAQADFHTQGDIWGLKPFVFMAAWGDEIINKNFYEFGF